MVVAEMGGVEILGDEGGRKRTIFLGPEMTTW
jgi:hypothetical protein